MSLLICCNGLKPSDELLVPSLDRSAAAVGLDRRSWTGDEEFAVIPAGVPEHLVVDAYVRRLDAELRWINYDRIPAAQLRLRIAMHQGPVSDTALVRRLLDSEATYLALDGLPTANLVLILSEHLYDSVVVTRHTSLRPEDFIRVPTSEGHGWLWLPHSDVRAMQFVRTAGDVGIPAQRSETRLRG